MSDMELFINLTYLIGSLLFTGLGLIISAIVLVSLCIGAVDFMAMLGRNGRRAYARTGKRIRRPSANGVSADSLGSGMEVAR